MTALHARAHRSAEEDAQIELLSRELTELRAEAVKKQRRVDALKREHEQLERALRGPIPFDHAGYRNDTPVPSRCLTAPVPIDPAARPPTSCCRWGHTYVEPYRDR